jgi:hypothetical protein
MGACKYCSKPAGFLKSLHKDCAAKHTEACKKLPEVIEKAFSSRVNARDFSARFNEIATAAWIDATQRHKIIVQGLERQATQALDDGILTVEEEARILEFQDSLGVTKNELMGTRFQLALTKAAVIRDLDDNIVKSRIQLDGGHSFLLARGETVLWAFINVTLYELKTRTSYSGRSQGVSVRLAKGLYVRAGASKGHKIETTNLEPIDVGTVAITNDHFLFSGTSKSIKIKFAKIISLKVFDDALEITKESANPKPQLFSVDDPSFAANLINKIVNLH